jgi:hypothetical protein
MFKGVSLLGAVCSKTLGLSLVSLLVVGCGKSFQGNTDASSAVKGGITDPVQPPLPIVPFSAITPASLESLATTHGKWSFGEVGTSGGGNIVMLNANPAGTPFKTEFTDTFLGTGVELVADNTHDKVYVHSPSGLWYRWNDVDQWTLEVTGDPRNPAAPPALGPNQVRDYDFATGLKYNGNYTWFFATTNDAPCQVANGCSYAVENVSPNPSGFSLHMSSVTTLSAGYFVGATPGTTYLMSVWTSGSGGEIHKEHDTTFSMGATIAPSNGWVQTICKFVPASPNQLTLMNKVYAKELHATNFYFGPVDPGYPAPQCQVQNSKISIQAY